MAMFDLLGPWVEWAVPLTVSRRQNACSEDLKYRMTWDGVARALMPRFDRTEKLKESSS